MTKDLSDFLKKPSKPIEEPQKTSSVSQLTEEPKKRIYTCADGKTITLDDLKPEDKQDYQKRFLPLGTGKGIKQRHAIKYTFHEKQYPDVYRKEPEYITKFKAYDPNAGLERLPLYSVLLIDEIGALLKPEDGLNKSGFEKPLDVSDMFRLGGLW